MDDPVGEAMAAVNPVSFEEFVRLRGDALWRSAWLLTGDDQRAESLLQRGLTGALQHWPELAREGSIEGQVRRTIVTTYCGGRWWRGPGRDGSGGPVVAPAGRVALGRLDALSRPQRSAVVLRYFDRLTQAQLAAAFGDRVDAATQLRRAVARLRRAGAERGPSAAEAPGRGDDEGSRLHRMLDVAAPEAPARPGRAAEVRRREQERRTRRGLMAAAGVATAVALVTIGPHLLRASPVGPGSLPAPAVSPVSDLRALDCGRVAASLGPTPVVPTEGSGLTGTTTFTEFLRCPDTVGQGTRRLLSRGAVIGLLNREWRVHGRDLVHRPPATVSRCLGADTPAPIAFAMTSSGDVLQFRMVSCGNYQVGQFQFLPSKRLRTGLGIP